MKNFYFVSGDLKEVLVESEVVRQGYLLLGTIGLVESIDAFRANGISVIVDNESSEPFILTESSVLYEGWFDTAKEKLGNALKAVKEGILPKDKFEEIYQELKREGKLSDKADFSGAVRNMTSTSYNPLASAGRFSSPLTTTSSVSSKPHSVATNEDPKKAVMTPEQLAKKVANYKKMFAADVAKYKKIFAFDPTIIDNFRNVLKAMVGDREERFASLTEAELPTVDKEKMKRNYTKIFKVDMAKYKNLFKMAPDAVDQFIEKLDEIASERDSKFSDIAGTPVEQEKPAMNGFVVQWDEGKSMELLGNPEVGSLVEITKVEGTDNIKVGETGKITKPVSQGKPLFMEMLSGDNKGKTYNTKKLITFVPAKVSK